jgi:hypothetical protein
MQHMYLRLTIARKISYLDSFALSSVANGSISLKKTVGQLAPQGASPAPAQGVSYLLRRMGSVVGLDSEPI